MNLRRALFQNAWRSAAILLAFTVIGTALLAFTFDKTRVIIERNEEEAKLALIHEILPQQLYDNDLMRDQVQLAPSEDLGTTRAEPAYRARLHGAPSALVFEATAPDGYSGKIKLLLAVRANGEVLGVRVVAHNETPGLGDYIDIHKSDWIRIFDRTSFARNPPQTWRVKKDGGTFDYVTGATITPRAIVKAVYKALKYYDKHGAALFAAPEKSTL